MRKFYIKNENFSKKKKIRSLKAISLLNSKDEANSLPPSLGGFLFLESQGCNAFIHDLSIDLMTSSVSFWFNPYKSKII